MRVVLCAGAIAGALGAAVPSVELRAQYPKRSNADAALLEWGSSAIIHNADGVVASFGPGATHPEFELGIEAELVTASPRMGCEPLTNAKWAATQIVVMVQGGCDTAVKVKHALAAGAAALVVVNNDRRSPDRAYALSLTGSGEALASEQRPLEDALPTVMISYAAGQQLREHSPRRMRLFAGGGRPFIESVTDAQPVLYLVHNAITDAEIDAVRAALEPALRDLDDGSVQRAHRVLGVTRGALLEAFYERVGSIVGYPVEHLSEMALERRRPGGDKSGFRARDEKKQSSFSPNGWDDAREQPVMTLYVYLNDVPSAEGGGLIFSKARPATARVQPTKGLAAVFYSALEDGSLDRSAAHGDAPLRKGSDAECWVLHMRVYAQPRALARRAVLPVILWPISGQPSLALTGAARKLVQRFVGDSLALDAALDAAVYALALVLLSPFLLLALLAFKLHEKAKAPPKRKGSSTTTDKPSKSASKKKGN